MHGRNPSALGFRHDKINGAVSIIYSMDNVFNFFVAAIMNGIYNPHHRVGKLGNTALLLPHSNRLIGSTESLSKRRLRHQHCLTQISELGGR